MSLAGVQGLDMYEPLAIGVVEFLHDLPKSSDDSRHREREAIHSSRHKSLSVRSRRA